MAEPAPAQAEQVLGGEPAAAGVVGQDRGLVAVHQLGHRVHHRDAQAQTDAGPRLDPPPGHDQPVHLAAEQHVQVLPLAVRVVPGIAHEHRDLAGPRASPAPSMTGTLNRPKLSVLITPTV